MVKLGDKRRKRQNSSQNSDEKLPSNFYEVNEILREKKDVHGQIMYYVSWKGYSKQYNSWVYRKTVMPMQQLILQQQSNFSSSSQFFPKRGKTQTPINKQKSNNNKKVANESFEIRKNTGNVSNINQNCHSQSKAPKQKRIKKNHRNSKLRKQKKQNLINLNKQALQNSVYSLSDSSASIEVQKNQQQQLAKQQKEEKNIKVIELQKNEKNQDQNQLFKKLKQGSMVENNKMNEDDIKTIEKKREQETFQNTLQFLSKQIEYKGKFLNQNSFDLFLRGKMIDHIDIAEYDEKFKEEDNFMNNYELKIQNEKIEENSLDKLANHFDSQKEDSLCFNKNHKFSLTSQFFMNSSEQGNQNIFNNDLNVSNQNELFPFLNESMNQSLQ